MACPDKLTADILFDCADAPKRGVDGGSAVLINWEDIDFAATTMTGGTVSDLALKSGTTGIKLEWYKDLASSTGTFAPNAEDVDGFTHAFLSRLPNSSAANAERANELKNGRFIIVYETKYKGALNAEAFKVGGIDNGLRLTELTFNTAENSGAMLFTLSTEEGDVERYPYSVLLEADYATTKASFDALFAVV